MEAQLRDLQARLERAEWRLRVLCGLALTAVGASILLARIPTAAAQSGTNVGTSNSTNNGIPQRLAALETAVTGLRAATAGETVQIATVQAGLSDEIGSRHAAEVSLANRAGSLENKTQFVSIGGDGEMYVTGTNLHIVNGLGNTDSTNGEGNLIIGYDEEGLFVPDPDGPAGSGTTMYTNLDRSGSHNLVAGPYHSYSSYGGLVAGFANTISGSYATVSGGLNNTASGDVSSISGGAANTAGGIGSSISGGNKLILNGNNNVTWAAGSYGPTTFSGIFRSP